MTKKIPADRVIDAAGGGHWLARRGGLSIRTISPRLIASYGYVRLPSGDHPLLRATAAGWTWSAEVQRGLYQWTQLPFGDRNLLPPVAGEAVGRPRSANVTWRWVPKAAGPGYFMVGDAAAVLDPSSSHGVLRALMSGMFAGHLIANAPCESVATSIYGGWLQQSLQHDVDKLSRLYADLPCAPKWVSDIKLDPRSSPS